MAPYRGRARSCEWSEKWWVLSAAEHPALTALHDQMVDLSDGTSASYLVLQHQRGREILFGTAIFNFDFPPSSLGSFIPIFCYFSPLRKQWITFLSSRFRVFSFAHMASVRFGGDREACNYNLVIFLSYHSLAEKTVALGMRCSLRAAKYFCIQGRDGKGIQLKVVMSKPGNFQENKREYKQILWQIFAFLNNPY